MGGVVKSVDVRKEEEKGGRPVENRPTCLDSEVRMLSITEDALLQGIFPSRCIMTLSPTDRSAVSETTDTQAFFHVFTTVPTLMPN